MTSSEASSTTLEALPSPGSTYEYAVGGIVRALCSVRLVVLLLAVADSTLRGEVGLLPLVALGAGPFSFVPALNWNSRGPVYFRNGVLLSGDIVVTVLVLVVFSGTTIVVAYGAATVALWGATTGLRVALLMAVPVVALLVRWTSLEGWRSLTGAAVAVAAVVGMAWAGKTLGDSVRRHQGIAAELARERAEHAASEERLRIARDLHDTVAGDLAGMRLLAQGLRSRLESGEREASCVELARTLDDATRVAHRHTRMALDELRSDDDLRQELARRCEGWSAQTGVTLRLTVDGPLGAVPRRVSGDARAVVGELLENVRKHADATEVTVDVRATDDGGSVVVVVEDDGRGIGPAGDAPDGHYGVRGIRERAEAVGGSAAWENAALGGTRVTVVLGAPGSVGSEPAPARLDEKVA